MSSKKPVHFEMENEAPIAESVMMYPYLDWQPGCKRLPRLTYRVSTKFTGELREHTCDVLGVLGSGAFGVVFRGRLEEVGPIAIKIPRQRRTDSEERLPDRLREEAEEEAIHEAAQKLLASPDKFLAELVVRQDSLNRLRRNQLNQEIIERFKRECGMLKRIAHPNVVHVHHVGEIGRKLQGGQWTPYTDCIVMEYLDAMKAESRITSQSIHELEHDLPTIIKFGRDIALGVAAIHDHGSPHRDLSWLNVVIKQACGTAVVVDLGNVIGETRELTLRNGVLEAGTFGLPGFIAPEQRSLLSNPASDQFSLGVQLYYWCTGQFPFDRMRYEPNGPNGPRALSDLCQDCSHGWADRSKAALDELSKVVMQSLAERPNDRHPSMRDFAARLEAILIDLGETTRERLVAEESTPTQSLLEDAKALKIRERVPQQIAAALVLQALARQCRFQIARFLSSSVELIEEFLNFSDDVSTLPELMTGVRVRAEKNVALLITILKELILALDPPAGTLPQFPRFGRELQAKIIATKEIGGTLLAAALARGQESVFERIERDRNKVKKSIDARNWAREYEEFFDLLRQTHTKFGNYDFEFAVYLHQIRRLANSLKPARGGGKK